MKLNKSITLLLCAATLTGVATSCSDSFLDEENIRQRTTEYFKTPEGIDDLAAAAYITFRFNYQYDWGAYLNENGTDEYTHGSGNANCTIWDSYNESLNASRIEINTLWNDMYAMIEQADLLIANVQQYYDKSSANYNVRLGEGHFFRGWAYYMLTSQMGGVPIKLEPAVGVQTYFTRNSEAECWAQVISDLEEAFKLLPASPESMGRAYKDAAAHFLAKAYLFRASERCDAFNGDTKKTDLENVIKYADIVIKNHPLASNYQDLWANDKVNSDVDNLSEIVFSAQFNQLATARDRFMNQQHLYFSCVYQNLPGMKRDISGGREFNSARPTVYTIEAFDRVNDSRFWKSFVTVHNSNNGATIPAWTAEDAAAGVIPEGATVGEPRYSEGEVGVKYIMNQVGDKRYTAHIMEGAKDPQGALKNGKLERPITFVLYFDGDSREWNNFNSTNGTNLSSQPNRGLTTAKYRDGSRDAIASQFGGMNGIIARSAEDYLMAAEAYIRMDNAVAALPYINALRKRAAYQDGEDRAFHVDGGVAYRNNPAGNGGVETASYSDTNTYYESNDMDPNVKTSTESQMVFGSVADCYNNPVDKAIIDQLGLSSEKEKLIAFILNERTRELCGEMVRWVDLSRTKTLTQRWQKFNYSYTHYPVTFKAEKHILRPIPQTFLDNITNEGGAGLTDEEKSNMQNPGY